MDLEAFSFFLSEFRLKTILRKLWPSSTLLPSYDSITNKVNYSQVHMTITSGWPCDFSHSLQQTKSCNSILPNYCHLLIIHFACPRPPANQPSWLVRKRSFSPLAKRSSVQTRRSHSPEWKLPLPHSTSLLLMQQL